ncbi:hypothetical protein N7539_009451 [Penicillium diatomitis]|uniref:Uncharacterized protein n=1 Tax=Penicillium diatomitis TaxID=2819901 RepID=A0A9X0BJA4_9EURO|nr:uncharacterized protein N7539_009451 [Penicillium diatomitis]KAJ5466722.1 hypothetical protein N7539_009451 [Penicillium diatomitis]
MAPLQNGRTNGTNGDIATTSAARFSDIPDAIDIPASSFDSEVEVSLLDLPEDPTELCTLLENERAAKNFWVIIALAYAKRRQLDHALDILQKGLASVAHGATKEKLGLLGWICWLLMLKSRQAPRVAPEGELYTEAKTKDYYLQQATSTLNEASRLNPAYPPLFLARGVLCLLRASLHPPRSARPGTIDNSDRVETLRQALKCFEESSKAFGGRNVMAIMGRARALYMLGRYQDALVAYQQVLKMMPNLTDPDPRIGLGCCLWQLNFQEQAKAAWERALSLNPNSKAANVLLAVYHFRVTARQSLLDPKFGAVYRAAAAKYAQKAFKLDKEYPMTCTLLGDYLLVNQAYPSVETLARRAIEKTDVMPIASDGWYLLARKSHHEGDVARATEYYNRSDQARGGGDHGYLPAKFGAIQMQITNNDLEGAKFRLEKIVQSAKTAETMTLLGALLAEEVFAAGSKEDKSAERQRAITMFEAVRSMWKDEKQVLTREESVLVYLARLYESSAPEKSMQCLAQLEELQLSVIPDDERPEGEDAEQLKAALREFLPPQLLNNMGCFLYLGEKIALARGMFQAALNACVKSSEQDNGADHDALLTTISYNLGRTYEAADMRDEAKKVYEGVLERHSGYTEANARLTYIALCHDPTDEGPKRIAKLYETESTNLEVRALFGWYLSRSKKRTSNVNEDAEQRHYKHTLQYHDKHDCYALTGMGNVHLQVARDMRRDTEQDKEKRRKMYQRAVEFFDKALQLDPQNAYAAQGIAIALIDDKKDHSNALQILTRVRDTVQDPSVYLNLGHVYAELRQYSRSIEHYEAALNKDRARDVQILACLGRVWQLKAKHETSLQAMKTALDYAQRARAVSPEAPHCQFNVAYVQNQIAQLSYTLQPHQKSVQDVEEAAEGLKEAIETFDRLSKEKHPPYPASALEQRANMGRTIAKQLERALQSQKEYEEKNATKLREAREARAKAIAAREEQVRQAQEIEAERKRKLAAERAQMIEELQRHAVERAERERAREEAELTEGSDGERVKRKKKSSKRKKKDDFVAADDEDLGGRDDSDAGGRSEGDAAPKKKRRLERRSAATAKANSKYKSSEMVVDSDDSDEEGAGDEARGGSGSPANNDDDDVAGLFEDDDNEENNDEEQQDNAAPRRRGKAALRIEDDEDEEDEQEAGGDTAQVASPANGISVASPAAGEGDDDELFGDTTMQDE